MKFRTFDQIKLLETVEIVVQVSSLPVERTALISPTACSVALKQ